MKRFIMMMLMSLSILLGSCEQPRDFQVLNYSDADWESFDPFDAHKMVMADLTLLLKKHQENPDISFPEDDMQTFYERLLHNFQFFRPAEDSAPTMPLTCKGKPVRLTEEESLEKVHLLLSWTEGKLFQFHPQTFDEPSEGYFNMIGLKPDLDGIATVLQAETKTETAMQAVVLLAIRRPLTDWESKGDAKLYWWSFKNKRSLLYITHRTAIVFYENELGKTEIIFCLNREYFKNRGTNREETTMTMPSIPGIMTATAPCLAAGTVYAAQVEQAEQQIRLQWQSNLKLSYHTLSCKGTLREWLKGWFHVREVEVRTMQGTWIPIQELPSETLVFRGESKGYKPGKTKGGVGYFFCSSESGKLIAYLLTK